ncbi:MAG TPA: hypothetical protein VF173_13135 [Thermoanaerobaculia bacterium]|nr:hypothetical protein [Thermoanaerobaculia bacterium]
MRNCACWIIGFALCAGTAWAAGNVQEGTGTVPAQAQIVKAEAPQPSCGAGKAETALLGEILGTVTAANGASWPIVKRDLSFFDAFDQRVEKGCICGPQCYPIVICNCVGTPSCCSGCCHQLPGC